MKKHFTLFLAGSCLLYLTSCSSGSETKDALTAEKSGQDSTQTEAWFPETNFDTLRGLYTGDFGDGFINVVLTYVNDKKAIGYNVHKGLQRNISGSVVQKKDQFELTLNEPGDNPYDGVFTLIISKTDGSVQASWKANDPKISAKNFQLKKQAVKKTDDNSKSFYDGGKITETNFIELFSYSGLDGDNLEFKENGILVLTYYPEGQENEQMETVKGSWKFSDSKTMIVNWAKNTRFKDQTMSFKLIQKKDEMPYFEGPDKLTIYPNFF